MLSTALSGRRATSITLAVIIALLAVAFVRVSTAEAHSSPGGCSFNRWDVAIGVDQTDAVPGTDVTFTILASNIGDLGCDVEDITIVFTDPGGNPTNLVVPPNYYAIGTAEFQVGQVVYTTDAADAVGGYWTGTVNWTGTLHQGGNLSFSGDKSLQVEVNLFDLDPTKTAEGESRTEYEWEIEKTGTPDWNLFDGDTGTSEFTVTVTKSPGTTTSSISGTITIENPAPVAITVKVTDSIDGQSAEVDCGSGSNEVTIPAGESAECDYVLEDAAGDEDENVATVTITDGNEYFNEDSYEAKATVIWGNPEVINDEITVTDTASEFGGPKVTDESDSWTYDVTLSCAGVQWDGLTGSYTYQNTATIDETGDSDKAFVKVDCYRLQVTKDADTSFDREYDWGILKEVVGTSSVEVPGGTTTATFSYRVTVNVEGSTDSNWAVTGTVSIYNPNPTRDAVLTSLTDVISPAIAADLECDWDDENVIPAGETVECTYDETLPDGTSRTNTATATQQNYAFHHTNAPVAGGTKQYTDTANVTFGNTPDNVTDECADVTDSEYGDLGEVCVGDAPLVETYDLTWDLDPAAACGVPQAFVNIATVTEQDTEESANDDATVTVTVQCAGFAGCTPGFWKTRTIDAVWGPTTYSPNTLLSAAFSNLNGFNSTTMIQALNFGGGPGVNGAKQILLRAAVASLLNSTHPDVSFEKSTAEVIAAVNAALASNDRNAILALATTLDNHNNEGCSIDAHGNPI